MSVTYLIARGEYSFKTIKSSTDNKELAEKYVEEANKTLQFYQDKYYIEEVRRLGEEDLREVLIVKVSIDTLFKDINICTSKQMYALAKELECRVFEEPYSNFKAELYFTVDIPQESELSSVELQYLEISANIFEEMQNRLVSGEDTVGYMNEQVKMHSI